MKAIHQFLEIVSRAVLVLACFMVLVGCGGVDAPEFSQTDPSAPYRVLLVGDPFANAMRRARPTLESWVGSRIEIEVVGYNDGRRLALLNAADAVSRYDLIAFDIVWLGEYVERKVLLDVTQTFAPRRKAFLAEPVAGCEMNGRLWGVPIQPHAELLWVRRDLLEAAGLSAPRTTDELLDVARALHNPSEGIHGIAWNAQRGQPLGQTMAHVFAAFGQPLLDENGLPAFHTERGLRAARHVKELVEVSPPDIFNMAWDQRTSRFSQGQVAMTYGWAARARLAEEGPASRVEGKVLYLPAPHAPGIDPVTPLGVWAIGVPSNVANPARSLRLLNLLAGEEAQRLLFVEGNSTPPLVSLLEGRGDLAPHPAFQVIGELDALGELSMEMRPRIPQWDALCAILGEEFHDMLLGRRSPEEALARAHSASLQLFVSQPVPTAGP